MIASSVPLYGLVKQEYIPSDVDEAEFEVSVTAPEGTSLGGHGRGDARGRDASCARSRRATVLATAGGGFLGGVNYGQAYVRIAPHEERMFSLDAPLARAARRRPAARLPRQLHPARRDAGGPQAAAQVPRPAHLGAQRPVVQHRRRQLRDRLRRSAAPSSRRSRATPSSCAPARKSSAASSTPTPRSSSNKPELRVVIDRERAADLGVRHRGHRHARCA